MTAPTPDRRRGPRRATDRVRRWPWRATGPYLAMCALVIVGFYAQAQDRDRIEREALARDRRICETDNERAASIRLFITLLVEDDGISPGERDALELADRVFADKECPPEPR